MARRTVRAYISAVAALGAVGALAWVVHIWADRAVDPAYDDTREVAEHTRHPPERLQVLDGLRLADGTGADVVNPQLLDVSLDRALVRVHGREVVSVPSDGGALPQTGSSRFEVRPLANALAFWRDLRDAADARTRDVNLLVDARVPYAIVAAVLSTLGTQVLGEIHLVLRRPDGTLGAIHATRGGVPSCRLAVVPNAGGFVMDRPYTQDALSSLAMNRALVALAGEAGPEVPVPAADTAGDPCFPPSRDTLYVPLLSPEKGTPFQDVVTALEAAQRALGGAMLGQPREP